ncbi:MAG: sigma-70 family RNA polymerase sigma factor [Propionibacteriales bacterium]|nr:sigma-70 family RNA polymerase sigma factor [Propionibacteriales bacterium]
MTDVVRPGPTATSPAALADAPSDPELIAKVRSGDAAAYEELFLRHREVAIRYARRISDSERAEDLCAEAFAKILDLLQRGKGPDVAFRAYLLTTVRTSHLNNLRGGVREDLVPDHEPISRMTPVIEDPDARFDQAAICRAFTHLPERWQRTLWLTAVEGLSHDEVGEHLGIKPNAVASLAFRARAGLRQAYLNEHLLNAREPDCRATVEQLSNFVRGRVGPRRSAAIQLHLDGCTSCTKAALELAEVDHRLGALLAPIALLGAGGVALSAPTTGLLALLKGALPSVIGAKTATVAGVAALSLAVGVEVVQQQGPPPPSQVPGVRVRTSPESAAGRFTPPAHPRISAPGATATLAPSLLPTLLPFVEPRHPSPAVSPPGSPSATPTTTPPPAAPSAPAARSMAIGKTSTEQYQRAGNRWDRALIEVQDPPEGARLVVTTNRTYQAARATTAGTGWSCGAPTMSWFDGGPGASSRTVCRYSGGGDGSPLRFDYVVAPDAALAAAARAPDGYLDVSLLDNTVRLSLRT